MSDEQTLYFIIVALYLLECAAWPRLDEVAFVERHGTWKLSQPLRVFGAIQIGLVFVSPLPPLGTLLVARDGEPDAVAVRERVAAYRLRSRALRVACNAVVIYLLAGAPAIVALAGLEAWPVLLVGLGVLTCATGIAFALAHRRLYPSALDARVRETILVALVPTVAARAHDHLARPLLSGLHPIAAVAALCAPEAFQRYARAVWRAATHPPPGEVSKHSAIERVLRRVGADPAALNQPPQRTAGSRSYCPRCEAQYVVADGRCAECPWVELTRF